MDTKYVEGEGGEYEPLLRQLKLRFPNDEIWLRVADYERERYAAVVRPHRGVAAIIPLERSKRPLRLGELGEEEILQIENHLSVAMEDQEF